MSLCMETIGAEEFAVASEPAPVCDFSGEPLGPVLEEFAGNTALPGSACVPICRGMYTPPATSTLTPMSAPIASHKPLRDVAEGIDGGGTAPADGWGTDMGIVGTGEGVRAGAGLGPVPTPPGFSVSIRVVAPVEGLGVAVTVVPAVGSAETGTLFNAARNASAD